MPQFDAHTANSEYTAAELTPANPRHPRPVFVRHMGVDAVTFQVEPDGTATSAPGG